MEFRTLLLLSLPLLFSIHFLLRLRRRSNLPPGPAGLPVLGSLLAVGQRPHETLAKLAATHGPLMTVRLGSITTVVATTSAAAREVLQKHDQAFLGRTVPYAVTAEADYELAMAWLPGSSRRWRRLRKLCAGHLFTAQRLESMLPLRYEMMDAMVRRVADEASTKNNNNNNNEAAVSIQRVVFGTMLSLLSNTMFSRDVVDPGSKEVDVLKEVVCRIMEGAGKRSVADAFPVVGGLDPQGVRKQVKVSYDRLHALLDETIDRRVKRRGLGEEERCEDFLDVLLDHSVLYENKEEIQQDPLSRQDIKVLLTVSISLPFLFITA